MIGIVALLSLPSCRTGQGEYAVDGPVQCYQVHFVKNLKPHSCMVSDLLLIRRWHCLKNGANSHNPALVSNSFRGDRVTFPRKPEVSLSVAKTMFCICIVCCISPSYLTIFAHCKVYLHIICSQFTCTDRIQWERSVTSLKNLHLHNWSMCKNFIQKEQKHTGQQNKD